jgi:hypothetical protein
VAADVAAGGGDLAELVEEVHGGQVGPRPGQGLFKPLRQLIQSVNDTLKGQLDLERSGGRTIEGVTARVLQRLLALTAAICTTTRSASRSCAPWSPTTIPDPLESIV